MSTAVDIAKLVHCVIFFLGQIRRQTNDSEYRKVFLKHVPIMLAHRNRPGSLRALSDAIAAMFEATDALINCRWTAESVTDNTQFQYLWFCYGNFSAILERLAEAKQSFIPIVLKVEQQGRRIGLHL